MSDKSEFQIPARLAALHDGATGIMIGILAGIGTALCAMVASTVRRQAVAAEGVADLR